MMVFTREDGSVAPESEVSGLEIEIIPMGSVQPFVRQIRIRALNSGAKVLIEDSAVSVDPVSVCDLPNLVRVLAAALRMLADEKWLDLDAKDFLEKLPNNGDAAYTRAVARAFRHLTLENVRAGTTAHGVFYEMKGVS